MADRHAALTAPKCVIIVLILALRADSGMNIIAREADHGHGISRCSSASSFQLSATCTVQATMLMHLQSLVQQDGRMQATLSHTCAFAASLIRPSNVSFHHD